MSEPIQNGLRSWMARLAIAYLENVPAHRGQARLIDVVGRRLGPVPMRCTGNARLLLRLDSLMDRSYVMRGRLDHDDLMSELAQLVPGDIFVDVGANAGLYTIVAANAVSPGGRVLAFEPSRDEFCRLAWAIFANEIANVQAFNFALANSSGFVGFVPSPSSHTGLHHLREGSPGSDDEQVWAERGDVAVRLGAKEHIALMKVDVEGAELLVLQGFDAHLRSGQVHRLVVEVTDEFLRRFGSSAAELYGYLSGLGYEPQKGPQDRWQYDEVFVHRRSSPGLHPESGVADAVAGPDHSPRGHLLAEALPRGRLEAIGQRTRVGRP
jgi:FkbM family methyltransferase